MFDYNEVDTRGWTWIFKSIPVILIMLFLMATVLPFFLLHGWLRPEKTNYFTKMAEMVGW